jgi:tetratricopeptide (TPR) repeat protein
MGQGGRNWNEWLSVEGSAYIEIQAGLAHTQLEHIPMPKNTVWEWTEAYTALSLARDTVHGDYKTAVSEAEKYMLGRVGNPDELRFPNQKEAKETKIIYKGSGWGAVEELARGEKISDLCLFPQSSDTETEEWTTLIKENRFPDPDTDKEPASYVVGKEWLSKLESLPEQSWYSLLHIGVIKYADGDLDGAKKAWEASVELKPSPWALRNLSMLYKNELFDIKTARKYILEAFKLKQNCPALSNEVAAQLTADGGDEIWLEIFDTLSDEIKNIGRVRLYRAVALINLGRLKDASKIINPDFTMSDIKEGELSVSQLWFELYRRLYAEENGIVYDRNDKNLIQKADEKYPLPKKLDFRMHD